MPRLGQRQNLETRFSRYVEPEPNTGCWLWSGVADHRGPPFKAYGRIEVDGRLLPAHRVAWVMSNGPIPEGVVVCHRCDVPLCVNPDHLFLGTHKDNTQDMVSKGRDTPTRQSRRGTRSNWNKLSPAQVFAIRADPRPQHQIAAEYEITQTAVSRIKLRKIWRHL